MTSPHAPSGAASPLTRRGGLVQEVVEHLHRQIRSGRLQPGDKLPTESSMMAMLMVSRPVVREAISRLQASGLVQTRHGIGTFVLPASGREPFRIDEHDIATVDDVIAVLELRIALETEAAGLAAQRAGPSDLSAMAASLDGFAQAIHEHTDAVPSDFQFHTDIARATGNQHFHGLMGYLGTRIIPRTRVNTPQQSPEGREAYLERVHAEHLRILQAISRQDAEAARAAMRAHLSNSLERLARARHGL